MRVLMRWVRIGAGADGGGRGRAMVVVEAVLDYLPDLREARLRMVESKR